MPVCSSLLYTHDWWLLSLLDHFRSGSWCEWKNQCCGSSSSWRWSGSGCDFLVWCRSRSGFGSYLEFTRVGKSEIYFGLLFTIMPVYFVLPFSSVSLLSYCHIFLTAYWNFLKKSKCLFIICLELIPILIRRIRICMPWMPFPIRIHVQHWKEWYINKRHWLKTVLGNFLSSFQNRAF